MSEDFQPGDRVEYVGDFTRELKGRTGTVKSADRFFDNVEVDWDGDERPRPTRVMFESLKRLEPAKPEIRVGDLVRLSLEGVVDKTSEYDSALIHFADREGYYHPARYDVEILDRKVEPLKPGDYVQGITGRWLIVDDGAVWRIPDFKGELPYKSTVATPEDLARCVADGIYTLVE